MTSFLCRLSVFLLLGFVATAPTRADAFRVFCHNLDGSPLKSTSTRSSTLQVFLQVPGSEVQVGSLNVSIGAPKNSVPLASVPIDSAGIADFAVDLPDSLDFRAIVLVAQRFDESQPTAAVPFLLEPQGNGGVHEIHIVVPKSAAPVMAPLRPSTSCRPRCRLRCLLPCRR